MEVKEEIFELLLKDYELVRKIANELDIQEASVLRWGYRKQNRCVALYPVVKIIMAHTGMTEEQIFEPIEKVSHA